MNYQRTCRSGCYSGGANMQRMAPRYSSCERESAVYGERAAHSHTPGGHAHSDLKLPVATSLAMVYSPVQVWRDIYDLECALERGTLFAELDKPLLSAGR